MKYIKTYESSKFPFNKINSILNILGFSVIDDGSVNKTVNMNFCHVKYSILDVYSYLLNDNHTSCYPKGANTGHFTGTSTVYRTVTINRPSRKQFFNNLIYYSDKFIDSVLINGVSDVIIPNGITEYKKIIIDFLQKNMLNEGEVIIPQSSIDIVEELKYINPEIYMKLINGVKNNNPLFYDKIKDENSETDSDFVEMGFLD